MFCTYVQGAPVRVTMRQLRAAHPNMSLPRRLDDLDDAALTSLGVHKVAEASPPPYDSANQRLTLTIADVDGVPTRTYAVEDIPDARLAQRVRLRRDDLLAQCDWTQVADNPIGPQAKAAWVQYRNALRDVPQQAGFPRDVVWPTKPGE